MEKKAKNRIITLSREYGSAGSEIGRRLAESLGIPCYDKDYVLKTVENSGLSTEFLEQEENRFISSLLFSLATGGYRHSTDKAMADQVFIAESNALREVARQGACVIVGRCADYVLKNDYDVFSVFVYADSSVRVRRAIEEYGEEARRAEIAVREKDRSRARHYEYYTGRTWGEPDNYHLCVNSGRLGIDRTVTLIRQALELMDNRVNGK